MRTVRAMSLCLLLGLCSVGCTNLRYLSDEELWAKSEEHFDKSEYDDAIEVYDELLRRNDVDGKALLMRGVSHERIAAPEKALRDYGKAGTQGEAAAVLYSANLNLRQGNTAGAEEDLGKLRGMNLSGRDQVIQLVLLGTLRLKQGRHRLAAQSLERAVESGKGFGDPTARRHLSDAHYNASQAYYHLGDFARAYDHMLGYARGAGGVSMSEEQLLQSPNEALSGADNYMLGLLAYLNHDYEGAEVHLSRADGELVAKAAEILDDPTFGPKGGLK